MSELQAVLGRRVPTDTDRVTVKRAEDVKGLAAPVYQSQDYKDRAASETERIAKAGTGTRPYYQN